MPETIAIIGSGPAAWTAAIYAARAALNPIVFEGEISGTQIPGGQLMLTTDIENYPGFPAGVSGPELIEKMREQAMHYGARIVTEMITAVDFAKHPFVLTPHRGDPVEARTVIVATGAAAKWIGLPNEIRLAKTGGGVSACAVCDGALPFFRNQVLAVVGGGDTAMEEASYLCKFAREVLIIHRRDTFRASKVMVNRVLAHDKIKVLWNSKVVEVVGDDEITGIVIEDTVTGQRRTIEVGGLFVAIGHEPNTRFLNGQLALTEHGYVKVAPWRTATSVPGVFAAGDVIDDYYRQAISSAGAGCMAALEAERWLAHHGVGESPVLETAEGPVPATQEEVGEGVL